MSFRRLRRQRKAADKEYERAAGVKRHDPTAERYAGGNTYSRADIERLERERLPWKRKR